MINRIFSHVALILMVGIHYGAAQGTAFTYQGRLNDGGKPANGIYDFQFTIYDLDTGGDVAGGPVTNSPTMVSNGLFAVTLDFGAGVFTGPSRWLEIGVRSNGGEAFSTLESRQIITASPYAIYSSSANAAGLNGTIAPGNIGNATITDAMLASGAVGPTQLAAGAVTTTALAEGAVTAAKVAKFPSGSH